MLVAQVLLFFCPYCMILNNSSLSLTYFSVRFSMKQDCYLVYLILRSFLLMSSRSLIFYM